MAKVQYKSAEDFFAPPIPIWKRGLDLLGAVFGLIVLSPILVIVALYIKLASKGPAIFKQKRIGRAGKSFTIWKFRTMELDAKVEKHQSHVQDLLGSNEPMAKLDDELKLIPCGSILRSSHIDELPQLVNVLRGEMSLVGPRPDVPYAVEKYTPWYMSRHNTAPGMTGLWQVSGKNDVSYEQMMRLDIRYASRRSFSLDAYILLKTIPAIVDRIAVKAQRKSIR